MHPGGSLWCRKGSSHQGGLPMHRFAPPLGALAAAALLAGCGGSTAAVAPAAIPRTSGITAPAPASPSASPVATNSVAIRNFDFSPVAITVPAGTTVTWKNGDIEQ